MLKQKHLVLLAATVLTSACAEQTAQVESLFGIEQKARIDQSAVARVRSDVAANGFPEPEIANLVDQAMTKALKEPGPHPLVLLVAPDHTYLYVGATSVRGADRSRDVDLVVKARPRGVVHVRALWIDSDGMWTPQPGSYRVELEPSEKKPIGKTAK